MEVPSVVLKGDNSVGEFFSVALTGNCQQADTGTKMIHVGKNTRSRIVSKGISAGQSRNCYRGLVQVAPTATGEELQQCDSMLIGDRAGANVPVHRRARSRARGWSTRRPRPRSARTSSSTSSSAASTPRRRWGSSFRDSAWVFNELPLELSGGEPAHEPQARGQRGLMPSKCTFAVEASDRLKTSSFKDGMNNSARSRSSLFRPTNTLKVCCRARRMKRRLSLLLRHLRRHRHRHRRRALAPQ